MARVDSADDSITRYVVRLYAFDESRHERRHQEIAAFDNEVEAMACVGETHFDLVQRRESGRADPREYVTMIVKEPGVAARMRAQRLEEQRIRARSLDDQ